MTDKSILSSTRIMTHTVGPVMRMVTVPHENSDCATQSDVLNVQFEANFNLKFIDFKFAYVSACDHRTRKSDQTKG